MKRVGSGLFMLLVLILFYPSMMQIFQALIDVFDTLLPGASNAETAFAHNYPFIILAGWVGIGIFLILSPFIFRGQREE